MEEAYLTQPAAKGEYLQEAISELMVSLAGFLADAKVSHQLYNRASPSTPAAIKSLMALVDLTQGYAKTESQREIFKEIQDLIEKYPNRLLELEVLDVVTNELFNLLLDMGLRELGKMDLSQEYTKDRLKNVIPNIYEDFRGRTV